MKIKYKVYVVCLLALISCGAIYTVFLSHVMTKNSFWRVSFRSPFLNRTGNNGIDQTLSDETMTNKRPISKSSMPGPRRPRNTSSISPHLYKMARPGVFEALPDQFLQGYKSPCWMFKTKNGSRTLRCLPYFYLIGFAKSGSTELWEKLRQHPQVYNVEKETRWWQHKFNGESFEDYLDGRSAGMVSMFTKNESLKSQLITGDGTPSFVWDNSYWQDISGPRHEGPEFTTADLLYAVQPDAKILLTLREPVQRLYSHYLHFYPTGTPEKFHTSTLATIARYRECLTRMSARACTYTTSIMQDVALLIGMYGVYMRDWLRVFPRDQIYIQRLEDWQGHCNQLLPKIHSFLELDIMPAPKLEKICSQLPQNTKRELHERVGEMLYETREILREFYAESNQQLSKLLGDDRFLWK